MKDVILFLAEIVDIGFFGFISFVLVHIAFKMLSKWSITAISFIYTFTMVLVFVFAIEIQQGITGSGNMEFHDAAISIVGFLVFFGVYLFIKGIVFGVKKLHHRRKQSMDM